VNIALTKHFERLIARRLALVRRLNACFGFTLL
jgi:hypothetical protein